LVDSSGGDGLTVTGTGFTYSSSSFLTGTVAGVTLFNGAHAPLITVTGLSLTATSISAAFATTGGMAVESMLMAGADSVTGSGVGDYIFSGSGADTIKGGGGSDYILGEKGNDVLWGGAGADTFRFRAGDGTDRIRDFHDDNLASDDHIAISKALYSHMVATDTATGVKLDFGAAGKILVDHWHVADLDITDFTLI
jgi:Ca2+-binding RTX toxin-like protein